MALPNVAYSVVSLPALGKNAVIASFGTFSGTISRARSYNINADGYQLVSLTTLGKAVIRTAVVPPTIFTVSDIFVTAATQSEAIVFESLKAVNNFVAAFSEAPNLIKALVLHSSDNLSPAISEGTHFPSPPPSSINTTPQLAFALSESGTITSITATTCTKLVDSSKSNSITFQF